MTKTEKKETVYQKLRRLTLASKDKEATVAVAGNGRESTGTGFLVNTALTVNMSAHIDQMNDDRMAAMFGYVKSLSETRTGAVVNMSASLDDKSKRLTLTASLAAHYESELPAIAAAINAGADAPDACHIINATTGKRVKVSQERFDWFTKLPD